MSTAYAHSPDVQQSLAAWARQQLAVEQQIPDPPHQRTPITTLELTATSPISLPVGAGWATADTTTGKRAAWVEAPGGAA